MLVAPGTASRVPATMAQQHGSLHRPVTSSVGGFARAVAVAGCALVSAQLGAATEPTAAQRVRGQEEAGRPKAGWVRTPAPPPEHAEAAEVPAFSSVWELAGEVFCDHAPTAPAPNAFTFDDGNRWSRTATDGPGLDRGDPTTITWGFVRDGTSIYGYAGEPTAPSNLIAFLDAIRGAGPGGSDLTLRPWFPVVAQVFAQWSARTGVRYVYEPADDGAALGQLGLPSGQLGVRADVRVGGHYIDGQSGSNILAYNFFPNAAEMVLDTSNSSFYASTSNGSRPMRNALGHEHGHGLGLEHVCPVNGSKLMEPFVSTAFDGLQEDDVLAGQRGYGDALEPPAGNDELGDATFLGAPGAGGASVTAVSIDGYSDVDVFSFAAGGGALATITLTPTGSTYASGPQGSNGSCSSGTQFDAKRQSDLTLELSGPSGSSIAFANSSGLGGAEVLDGVALPSGAGTYHVIVGGLHDKAQVYRLEVSVEGSAPALAVVQSDSEDPALAGASLWYTITLQSSGGNASGVVSTLDLPPGVTLLETSGCAEDPAGVPTCTLGTVNAGTVASYSVRVLVPPGGGTLDSSVTATWIGGGQVSDSELTQTVNAACETGDLLLDGTDSGDESDYLAEGTIAAGDGFTVANGESVRFVAGSRIVLSSAFAVAPGGRFRARTDSAASCP